MLLRVVVIDENGLASRTPTRFDITPPVAHHKALAEFDTPVRGGSQHQAGLRFPAFAAVPVVVITDPDVIKRYAATQETVNRLD
jgi:hypothetical protein